MEIVSALKLRVKEWCYDCIEHKLTSTSTFEMTTQFLSLVTLLLFFKKKKFNKVELCRPNLLIKIKYTNYFVCLGKKSTKPSGNALKFAQKNKIK